MWGGKSELDQHPTVQHKDMLGSCLLGCHWDGLALWDADHLLTKWIKQPAYIAIRGRGRWCLQQSWSSLLCKWSIVFAPIPGVCWPSGLGGSSSCWGSSFWSQIGAFGIGMRAVQLPDWQSFPQGSWVLEKGLAAVWGVKSPQLPTYHI
jgi:hypothetical protein